MNKYVKLVTFNGLILTCVATVKKVEISDPISNSAFSAFVTQYVQKNDREAFSKHYESLKKRRESMLNGGYVQRIRQEKLKKKLIMLGKHSLEAKYPSHMKRIEALKTESKKDVPKKIELLLFRVGAYEEFKQSRTSKRMNFLTQARDYIKNTRNKITSWFSHLRKTELS